MQKPNPSSYNRAIINIFFERGSLLVVLIIVSTKQILSLIFPSLTLLFIPKKVGLSKLSFVFSQKCDSEKNSSLNKAQVQSE